MTLQNLAQKNKTIFWDISPSNVSKVSNAAILERFIQFGNMDLIREILSNIKKEELTEYFKEITKKKRKNVSIKQENFFRLLLEKHA
jgi:hypothetical protein